MRLAHTYGPLRNVTFTMLNVCVHMGVPDKFSVTP